MTLSMHQNIYLLQSSRKIDFDIMGFTLEIKVIKANHYSKSNSVHPYSIILRKSTAFLVHGNYILHTDVLFLEFLTFSRKEHSSPDPMHESYCAIIESVWCGGEKQPTLI